MDENKIEITVELDTSKAEKQADDLNDALVDGAKDANKEFKKYSDSVNKNLNKIKQQVNKTFDGAKMANSLTSKVGKALNGIKSKINSILGNISINTKVDANVSSQGSTGASESGDMGTTIATTGMIGAMLTKSKDLGSNLVKPLEKALDWAKKLNDSFNKMRIGEEQFNLKTITKNLGVMKKQLEDDGALTVYGKTFSGVIDSLNGSIKEALQEVDKTRVSVKELETALTIADEVFNSFFATDGIGELLEVDEEDLDSYSKIETTLFNMEKLVVSLNQRGIKFVNPSDTQEFVTLLQNLDKATSGATKYRMVALHAFDSVGQAVSRVASTIGSKLNSGAFGKAISTVKNFGNTMKQSFLDGFTNPNKYIDNMKAKIKAWADNHKKATDKVKSANKSTGSSFKSLLQQVLPFASIYGVFNGLKTSITSFADGLQQSGKFATVFGSETQKMSEWLDEINSKVTTSKSTLMDFSSTLYRMGKNMGVATDDALSMAQSMTELGADLEAFTGDANSIDALAGALRGEYDSLQNYGYSLSASAVEARALAMGLDSASESALMMARQSLILEQSGDVLGYASGQAQTLSGQMAMLRKNFQALGTAIGSCFAGLLQVVLPVLNSIVSAVTNAFNKLAGLINSIFGLFGVKVGASGASGGGAVGSAIGGITDSLGSGLDDAGSGAGKVADDLASGAESAKEIAKGLMGIDEINTIGSPSDSGGGSGSGSGSGSSGAGGAGAGSVPSLDFTTGGESITDTMTGELTEFQRAFLTVFERIKQGFILFKDDILAEWSKLKANIDALGREMAEFFTSCWKNGLDDTALIFGSFISATIATGLQMVNSVVEVVTNLFNHLNPDNNENTKKFIDAINYLLEQIVKFVRDAGDWFSQFATACQPFINNLGDIAMIVGGILAEVLADAIQLVRDFMNSWAGQAIIEGIAGALEWLSGVLESCLGFIQEHITFFEALGLGILGAWGAFKLINIAIGIWNGLMTIFASIGAICSGVATALGGAIAFLTSPIGLVVVAIGALIAIGVALYKNWDEVKAWCTKAWDAICKGIQDAGKVIATTFDYMKTIAINKCKDIWNNIKTIWNGIKSFFSQVLNAIKNTISGVLNGIKTVFSGAWNVIKTGVSGTFNGIKNAISTVMNGIKSTISGIVNGVKTIFSNGFNACKTTVSNVFNGIKTSISNIMNGAKDIVSGIINKIKGFFKFTVSLPKIKLPHFTIKPSGWKIGDLLKGSIPKLGISWYSDGGIFPAKRLIGVGDASKGIGNNAEAVIPLDRLWSELGKQFTKQNQTLNKGNNQPVNITLKLDGREISKATFKNFEELSRLGIIDLSTLV